MKNNAFRILVTFFPLAIGLILLVIYAITFNKHLLYAIGFCTGLSAVFLLATILSFIMKKKFLMKKEFDERQLKNRGDCFSNKLLCFNHMFIFRWVSAIYFRI